MDMGSCSGSGSCPEDGWCWDRGTLYGILTRMHTEGYIRLESAEGRRKVYAITEAGTQALLEEYRRLKTMVQDGNILEEELK